VNLKKNEEDENDPEEVKTLKLVEDI